MKTNPMIVTIVAATLLCGVIGTVSAHEEMSAEMPAHLMVSPDEFEWKPVPSLPPGAEVAVIEGDPSKEGPFTMRLRMPANYDIPVHTHPATERVTVLSGTFYLGLGEAFDREKAMALPEGGLAVMESGLPMYAFTGDEPVVVQLNDTGPWGITYLDPAEDPRRKQQ